MIVPNCSYPKYSFFDTENIYNQLIKNDLEVTPQQTERILKIAEDFIHSKFLFYNIKKEKSSSSKKRKLEFLETTDLNNFKIHFFKNEKNHEIKIYIHKRIKKGPQVNTDIKKGGFKVFNPVFNINLDYGEKKTVSILKKARLCPNYDKYLYTGHWDKIYKGFKKEIVILEKFKDVPNVCQIESSQEYQGSHQGRNISKIVMYQDLYQGDLSEIKKDNLPLETILKIFKGCIDGLDIVHNKGILHGDLKQKNIFLDKENNPYIADFGGSAPLKNWKETVKNGTPSYFSPEKSFYLFDDSKISHKESLGTADDLWSLGCSILSLITHSSPLWGSFLRSSSVITKLFFLIKRFQNENMDDSKIEWLKVNDFKGFLEKMILDFSNYPQYLKNIVDSRSDSLIDYFKSYPEENKKNLRFINSFLNLKKYIENIDNNFPTTKNKEENDYIKQNKELIFAHIYKRLFESISTTSQIQIRFMEFLWNRLREKNLELDKKIINPSSENKVLKVLEKIFVVNQTHRITLAEAKVMLA